MEIDSRVIKSKLYLALKSFGAGIPKEFSKAIFWELAKNWKLTSHMVYDRKLLNLYEIYSETLKYKSLPSNAVTLEKFIIKYGYDIGNLKWNLYREKQATTNTLEYKIKHGIVKNEEEFKSYNKSRSVTKENFINRHGEDVGNNLWNSYRERQAFTNTKAHLGEKYENVNRKKRLVKSNFISKYGEVEGEIRFNSYIDKISSSNLGYSKISQKLFYALLDRDIFKQNLDNIYFAEYNKEFVVYDKSQDRARLYDFVCVKLKLVIEFNGDHWHGNPLLYSPDEVPILLKKKSIKKTCREVWEEDDNKNLLIKNERGFHVITIWENDYRKFPEEIIEKIVKYAESIRVYK